MKNYKILYLHSKVRIYRCKLFELLSLKLNIKFLWTSLSKNDDYIRKEVNEILSTHNINSKQAKEIHKLPFDSFSFDLLKLFFSKYDLYIFSSILSVPFLILAPILKIRKKKILVFDELWRYPKEIKKYRFIYFYVKYLVSLLDGVIVSGSKCQEFFLREYNLGSNKISIAYNTTIDTRNRLTSIKINKNIKSILVEKTKKKKILFLARVIKIKGLDILINAMNTVDISHDLVVVGDGNELQYCKNLTKKFKLEERIHFLGSCLSYESPYYINNCDIFVLPSRLLVNDNPQLESWGFTLSEAMYLEKPVVTTNAVGSAFDLVYNEDCGMIAEESSSDSLSKSINFVIHNNKNNRLGKNARKSVLKKCSYEENFNIYDSVINKVLSE